MRLKVLSIIGTITLLAGSLFGLAQVAYARAGSPAEPPASPAGDRQAIQSPESPLPPGSSDAALVAHLSQQAGGSLRISYHAETGAVRFIGATPNHPIPQSTFGTPGAARVTAARGFLDTYGRLFGLQDPGRELTVVKAHGLDDGRSFVRFQQFYQDVPVIGGELIVQENARGDVISASGEILPGLHLDTTPGVDAETARHLAQAKVARDYGLAVGELTASDPKLWIYNPAIIGGSGPRLSALVWRTEVTSRELLPIREFVLVDAQSGGIALHFNQIDTALYRAIYDNQNDSTYGLPGNGPVRVEGGAATGNADADAAYSYSGDTYNFYYNLHGRDSIDDAGTVLPSTVRYTATVNGQPICPNAFWNGTQMVYCEGLVTDDVVGHELTHGVTGYESDLFYWYQSGAINEAFSDIWGEFVDLTNGAGNDDPGVRWQLGEDIPVGLFGGPLRDMSDPPSKFLPDKMSSSFYYCGSGDNGGVHTNNGVGSKAAYLMTDGDSFNGYVVAGLGITRTAKIWYEVQTNLLTSASDYQDLYDGLQQACTNLAGTSGITASDCQQVRNAVDAVEMNQQPVACPSSEASICDPGRVPVDLFLDDMENPLSGNWDTGWLVGPGSAWAYPPPSAARYATSGSYNLWGSNPAITTDSYVRMARDVALPTGNQPFMHFNHAYGFEGYGAVLFDGGVLEYSTDGGGSWHDASLLIDDNGYSGVILSDEGNPLAGRPAFAGLSNGYVSSRLDLSTLAGQSVRFRFRIGTDSIGGGYGWFIDDVRIYVCGEANSLYVPLIVRSDAGS